MMTDGNAIYTTILDGLELEMRLGVHPGERVAPQRVVLSVRMTVDYDRPPADDRIDEVLDYDFVRQAALALADTRHFQLQESFCDAIAELCLADPRVCKVVVRSVKTDIYPDSTVGCEIIRGRAAVGQFIKADDGAYR